MSKGPQAKNTIRCNASQRKTVKFTEIRGKSAKIGQNRAKNTFSENRSAENTTAGPWIQKTPKFGEKCLQVHAENAKTAKTIEDYRG